MSSYLHIYGIPKNGGDPINIVSFSRSNPVYTAFCDTINVAWAGESEVYTDLTISNVEEIIKDLESDLKSTNDRLQVYERYAAQNPDYIQEIIGIREYIEELSTTKHYCELICYIVQDSTLSFSGFSKICCNLG